MAMDTVNGHSLPTDGNINTMSGSAEIAALVTASRIFAAAINTSGDVDASGVEGVTGPRTRSLKSMPKPAARLPA